MAIDLRAVWLSARPFAISCGWVLLGLTVGSFAIRHADCQQNFDPQHHQVERRPAWDHDALQGVPCVRISSNGITRLWCEVDVECALDDVQHRRCSLGDAECIGDVHYQDGEQENPSLALEGESFPVSCPPAFGNPQEICGSDRTAKTLYLVHGDTPVIPVCDAAWQAYHWMLPGDEPAVCPDDFHSPCVASESV